MVHVTVQVWYVQKTDVHRAISAVVTEGKLIGCVAVKAGYGSVFLNANSARISHAHAPVCGMYFLQIVTFNTDASYAVDSRTQSVLNELTTSCNHQNLPNFLLHILNELGL